MGGKLEDEGGRGGMSVRGMECGREDWGLRWVGSGGVGGLNILEGKLHTVSGR